MNKQKNKSNLFPGSKGKVGFILYYYLAITKQGQL